MESREYTPEEKRDMDISRTESDAELLRDGAERLDDGRIEITEDQNNEIYEEQREVNVGLNSFDFIILQGSIERVIERDYSDPSKLNDVMKQELSYMSNLIAKLEKAQSLLREESQNRAREIYGSEDETEDNQ